MVVSVVCVNYLWKTYGVKGGCRGAARCARPVVFVRCAAMQRVFCNSLYYNELKIAGGGLCGKSVLFWQYKKSFKNYLTHFF